MKLNLFKIQNTDRFKYGGSAALISILVVAFIVLLNLFAGKLPWKLDLSSNQYYSLSSETKTLLDKLPNDVTIYAAMKDTEADTKVSEALKLYANTSKKVKLEWIDLDREPGFVSKYSTPDKPVAHGSLVIVSGERSRVISETELYNLTYNQQTGQQQIQGIQLEKVVSSAINFVASGKIYTILQTSGHGEESLVNFGFDADLQKQNRKVTSINLLTTKDIATTDSSLMILSPKTDFTDDEISILKSYIDKGGNLMIFLNFLPVLPKLEDFIQLYGVKKLAGVVFEGSDYNRIQNNPLILIPDLQNHQITDPLTKSHLSVIFPRAAAFTASDLKRRDATVTSIIKSSDSSWLRTDLKNQSLDKGESEAAGPYDLVNTIEIKDSDTGAVKSRILLVGTSYFIDPRTPYAAVPGNYDLFMNMLSWTVGDNSQMSISAKYFFNLPFQVNGFIAFLLLTVFVVLVPLALFVSALLVWLKRKNR